jgi:Fe-S oxidoreductase
VIELNECVHCGFCLEACPTYVVTRSEVHSPRGRIMAMRLGIESQGLETCVFCRRCEEACPSGVPYGNLISSHRKADAAAAGMHRLLESPKALAMALRLTMRGSGPTSLRLKQFVKEVYDPLEYRDQRPEIFLFPGCLTSVVMRPTVERALRYLRRWYRVEVVNGCCGLPHQGEGERGRAEEMASKWSLSLKGKEVVVLSSNCAAHMKERWKDVNVYDFSEFVEKKGLDVPNVKIRVTLHEPCHAKVVGISGYTRSLLRRMKAEIVEMDDPSFECGAGGSYFLFQEDLADSIFQVKAKKVERTGVELVISTNPSCTMSLWRRFKVLHVADLLS